MTTLERIRQTLESCRQHQGNISALITSLFCEELGWGRPRGLMPRTLQPGAPVSRQVTAAPIAQMSGLPVYLIDCPDDRLPGTTARRAVQRALDPTHAEHVLVYVARNRSQLAFTRARQRSDGKIELRTLPYDVGSPARTTVERLAELAFSLDELSDGEPPITRVTDKLNAAFSVESVTKQFYQEVASWYFWALDHVRFPKDAPKTDGKDHVSLIRLITRLIFCWFLKEKGLIPATLFDPKSLPAMLNGFAPNAMHDPSSVFYKAIVQNLFFATLNTEMGRRDWAKDEQNFMAHNLYRHRELFQNPETALELFRDIPFLNGGLFECLDRIEGTKEQPRYIRIDGFSRRPDSQPVVPDALFFGEEREVDLSNVYGEARYRRTRVRGLIHILASYNFTLQEHTPFDQEVALDPELLGQVFENLLAAYNPETRTTARKATGSYYTPREIVDYMVEEALIACLKLKLETAIPDIQNVEARLRHLFAYNDEPHQFTDTEVETLIHAIDHLKILDPACGSGAFPMGILHRLVFVLGRLDPGNARWKERQIAKAQEIPDPAVRDKVITDIEQAFTANELDYGRKLYLIENCIYGVDIQPIAVQIAKLRFFISLVVDQRVNPNAENLGILALPNLETRFVAANTLIGIERPQQLAFRNPRIDELEHELARVREAHFTAKTPATKRKYRERDAALRAEIAAILETDGWDSKTARMLAGWDPYDQNASASFFDPEWMFGLRQGFDIVIGNPPYSADISPLDRERIVCKDTKNSNSAAIFIDVAKNKLTHQHGVVSFVVPKSLLYSERWFSLAEALAMNTNIVVDLEQAFENVLLEQAVFVFQHSQSVPFYRAYKFQNSKFFHRASVPVACVNQFHAWPCDVSDEELKLGMKMGNAGLFLRDVSRSFRGLPLQQKISDHSESCEDARIIGGKNIIRYGTNGFKGYLRRDDINRAGKKVQMMLQSKIISQQIIAHIQKPKPHIMIIASVDSHGNILGLDTVENTIPINNLIHLNLIAALFNSSLINWYAYKFIYCAAVRTMHFDEYYIGKIPLPVDYRDKQSTIVELVDTILTIKRDNPDADTSTLEREIDERVYRLYGLTPEEIRIVKESLK